ncbi:MAG: hypothetical protein EOO01_12885 [Chitinophagaceae bacterium]|nr:MAG: hypothetical protein EOO01_12885 [Chitinophagaceae bacterium]
MSNKELIPENTRGKEVNLEESVSLPTTAAAADRFKLACERLLFPQGWRKLTGKLSAVFEVMGDGDQPVSRPVKEGDYIRINIPGPGPGVGDGYDWVQVSLLTSAGNDDQQELGMKLMPCDNPRSKENEPAHFFKPGASSSFVVRLKDKEVLSNYYGRNEVVNNETGHVTDNIRNTMIGAGALAGLSELQWSTLIKAFLDEEKD